MKKIFYALFVLATILGADAASAAKHIYVWGYGASVNGTPIPGWALYKPVIIDAVDGKYTLNFELTPAHTTEVQMALVEDGTEFKDFPNDIAISPASTAVSGKTVPVIKRKTINFLPFTSGNTHKYKIVMNEDCTEATVTNDVWDGKLYVNGNGNNQFNGEWLSGNLPAPMVLEPKDGYFTLEGYWAYQPACFSIYGGTDWDYYNNCCFGPDGYGWDPSNRYVPANLLGQTRTAVAGVPNLYPPEAGYYTIKIKDDLTTFEVSRLQTKLMVCGNGGTINGNALSTEPFRIEADAEGNYNLSFELNEAGASALIAAVPAGQWAPDMEALKAFGISPKSLALNGTTEVIKSETVRFLPRTSAANQNYTIKLNSDFTQATVSNNVWDGTIYVYGDGSNTFNGKSLNWDAGSFPVKASDGYFTLSGLWNNAVCISLSADGGDDWAYINGTAMSDVEWWSPYVRAIPMDYLNNEYAPVYNVPNIYPPYPGNYTVRIKNDLSTIQFVAVPRKLVLCGSFNNFSTSEGCFEFETENGTDYTASNVHVTSGKIMIAEPETSYNWVCADPIIDKDVQDWTCTANLADACNIGEFEGSVNVTLPIGLSVDNISDWYRGRTAKVKFDGKLSATMIEAVTVDENAPVEYYNLQGVRVAEPAHGIFIRRQGAEVSKVIVK